MVKRLALVLLLAATFIGIGSEPSCAAATPEQGPRWESLSPEIKQVLTPVAPDWDQMPAFQRKRLVNAAKHYPKLSPQEQARFRERLPQWAKLPREDRIEARETYKKYHNLPQEQREELKKRWQVEKKTSPEASTDSSVPPSSSSASPGH